MSYEWEIEKAPAQQKQIDARNVHNLREQIKKISNVTLRQNFTIPADKQYWIERLTKLSRQLQTYEARGLGY